MRSHGAIRMNVMLTEPEMIDFIRAEVAKRTSHRVAACEWKISPTYLSFVLNGKTRPGVSILDAVGFERVTMYRPV